MDEESVLLGQYSEWGEDQWRSAGQLEIKVMVFFESKVYEACIIQFLPSSMYSGDEVVKKIRDLIRVKNLHLRTILSLVPRFCQKKLRLQPTDV